MPARSVKVSRKTPAEIELMRRAGAVLARTLERLKEEMRPGVTTAYLDAVAEECIRRAGAIPSFKGYNGYPATICVEVEDVVVHGIPSPHEALREGTVVGVDVGLVLEGWHADAAFTVAVGEVDELRRRLIEVTRQSLEIAIRHAKPGRRLEEISRAVQEYVEGRGFAVIRALVGHGIGRNLHEPPQLPNFYEPGGFADYEIVLRPGMTLAIEPMVAAGTPDVIVDQDGWTTRTADGMPS
ncbi:MAG: type I methionyl aminopeptidase, partial [Armatimonadetes bacterium]|nr:type I methionyl aminopeptidase [Armatimonadota bacterium]